MAAGERRRSRTGRALTRVLRPDARGLAARRRLPEDGVVHGGAVDAGSGNLFASQGRDVQRPARAPSGPGPPSAEPATACRLGEGIVAGGGSAIDRPPYTDATPVPGGWKRTRLQPTVGVALRTPNRRRSCTPR